ncbi:hypothetical protein [Streptomyces rimosus]|uniref:hypothetical protein n=1 Tax=Streptomyces rimosus TaxID=1927 RepID=UPI0004C744EF|nr:hypothetical protein [Streptomyces rimosus]
MPEPEFIFIRFDRSSSRFHVWARAPHYTSDQYLGSVYESEGSDWVADWRKSGAASATDMPGFASKEHAASALYRYAPPTQSVRSRPIGRRVPVSDERAIDMSQCGCCVTNGCECEGMNRISQRFGTTQTYQVQPSLIPETGVLIDAMPLDNGDFLVDLNTRGTGAGIGYLQKRDDGRYDARVGNQTIGIAPSPEIGMWACLQEHTNTKHYGRRLEGFEPHERPVYLFTRPIDK